MLEDFAERRITLADAEIYLRTGGAGPPLLLLHGYPQTHVIWHRVAARLAQSFTLVMPDLRGYGRSKGPAPDTAHLNYSKRAMARDMVEVMAALGYQRFALAGHDRGVSAIACASTIRNASPASPPLTSCRRSRCGRRWTPTVRSQPTTGRSLRSRRRFRSA
jgi:pimeloyl-ACP methyl ester carboxylesterase